MALEQLKPSVYLSRFTGFNPTRWLLDAEWFFSFHRIYEEERFPYVVEFFDDEPFYWFNSWYRGPERFTWKSFTTAMLHRFCTTSNLHTLTQETKNLQAKFDSRSTHLTTLPEQLTGPILKSSPAPKLNLDQSDVKNSLLWKAYDEQGKHDQTLKTLTDDHEKEKGEFYKKIVIQLDWRDDLPYNEVEDGLKDRLKTAQVDLQRMGELQEKPFLNSMKRKYSKSNAGYRPSELYLRLHEFVRDANWCPQKSSLHNRLYWQFLTLSVKSAPKTERREWRPPWLPSSRYVETGPNAVVRLEWRPPWTGLPLSKLGLEDKAVLSGGELIRA